MYVALGGSARKVEPYRVADYMAYYRGPTTTSRS
jgi:hypothetical protein